MSSRGEWVQAPLLGRYRWLAHGFTTRRLGRETYFNLGYAVTRDRAAVTRNRKRLLRSLKATGLQLVTLRQRHSDIVQVMETAVPLGGGSVEPDGARRLPGDALISNQPGVLLAVQTADCVPILLVDPKRRVAAAVHAGWRGTSKRIVEKAVGVMSQRFGTQPRDVRAALGPSIRRCCYQVGREVVEEFEAQFSYAGKIVSQVQLSPHEVHWQQPVHALLHEPGEVRPRPALTAPEATRYYLDLEAANRLQLRAVGVLSKNIWSAPLCTACHTDLFFSHRAEHGKTGRMMGVVGIRSSRY